jgi:tetratricopeptide (TPR) repeat protein
VIEHDPLYGPAFNNLTFNYLQTRRMDGAHALVQRVERITGDSPQVRFARGALAMANGELAAAMGDLGKAYESNPSASVVKLWYSTANFFIGDLDMAIETAIDTDKLVALELTGREAEARAIFESLQLLVYEENHLRGIGDWMLLREQPEELVAFLAELAGDDEDWIATQPRPNELWGAAHLTNVAYALLSTGQDGDAERVLTEVRQILDAQARNGANNLFFWINQAEYAALTGDSDAMFGNLRKATDAGYISTTGFERTVFNDFRGDPRFIELESENIRRANAERGKLGLQPI